MVGRAAVIAVFLALAQAGSAAAQGSLRGTVTAAGTGSAIAGAQVSLAGTGAFTGPGGTYEVGGIPEGIHEVTVMLIGYETQRRQVIIVDGQPTTLNVTLTRTTLELGSLVAVGSRRVRPRTVTESPVPVDVIPPREIVRQGDVDFVNVIRNVVPSFNVNIQPISDAATFVRPANLRGLAPDHTLVLVNGKRRHRAAVITWYGNGLADGSQ
ncbi:MAG: carboxypeptidase regulatory-like domain-containing protein, partial [Gemmatimonadota bacterium]|nr:carboxypeptidase regulatory-like domain-containing protein [Gemmatimonadota bacterium]